MVNKPKSQTLKDRIEKSVTAELDQDWQPHYTEAIKSLGTIEKLPEFNLLDAKSALSAAATCARRLETLQQIKKQVNAVNSLMKEKRNEALAAVDELPWPDSKNDSDNTD